MPTTTKVTEEAIKTTKSNRTMSSMTEIMQEAVMLTQLNQGWNYLPLHDTEHAAFGLVALRFLDADGNPMVAGSGKPDREEEVIYEWFPYGKRLEAEVVLTTDAEQFKKLVDDMRPRGIYRCDDPKARHVGFVSYDGEKARVIRLPLTKVKDGNFDKDLHTEILIGMAHLRLDPMSFTKRKPKALLPLDTPGTFCPNCGLQRTSPKDGDPKYPNMFPAMKPDPHTDPFDCIRVLREDLNELKVRTKRIERQ